MVRVLTAGRSFLALSLVGALLLVATGCGGGGHDSTKDPEQKDLVVVAFDFAGRTDVYRNQPVSLTFNVDVRKSTVNDRTVQFRTGPNLKTVARGRYIVDGNVVTFDPREVQQKLRDRTIIGPNPFGFEPLETYQVLVEGPPTAKRVESKVGKKVISEFFSTFRTTDKYMPELVQPRFIGDVVHGRPGRLAFNPEQYPEGAETEDDFEVRQDSLVVMYFDEAIDPATMDPGTTVIVRNETLTALFGREVLVTGTCSHDATAAKWTFESSFGFGQGPFQISVTFTPGIKDLAGNPLGNPTIVYFNTEFTNGVPNSNQITETFATTAKRDTANTTASWNGNKPGYLVGGTITTTLREIKLDPSMPGLGGGSRTRINSPLTDASEGSHTQMLYMQTELGGEGTISEVAWGPDSNALFAATHDRIIIKLGHYSSANLTSTYADNFNVGSPVRVYDGSYTIPQKANIHPPGLDDGYWPLPLFSSYFDYNGTNNVVLDWDVKAGTNFQIHRVFYGLSFSNPMTSVIPNRRLYGPFGATEGPPPAFQPPGNPEPTCYDMLFTKRRRVTIGQSTWYDSFVPNANYGTPVISPPSQSGGATFVLQFEGAKGMPNPLFPSQIIPDPATFSGFVDNIDGLDGYRFIRFKFTMIANLISNTVPEINSLSLPYIF